MPQPLTLMLLRHAKAGSHSTDDHARRLTEGGRADAEALGAYLAGHDLVPHRAYVSASARTRETFETLQGRMGGSTEVRLDEDLYNASAGHMRDMMRAFDADKIMIVGHNPGIMDAAVQLARDGDAGDLRRMRGRFPPCSFALISFDQAEWRDARASGGRLDLLLMPEDFGGPR